MNAAVSVVGADRIRRWKKSILARFAHLFRVTPSGPQELIDVLHDAESNHLIDGDTAAMMEGALLVSEMKVRDIMIPRSQMVFIEADSSPEEFLPAVIESQHSRFPVIDSKHERVVGIMLAKDLLPLAADPSYEFNIKDLVRTAVFVPESKRLNILLREFRQSRNHLALVVDEYGGLAGLVSIEDVIEQIVGNIDDEYDVDDEEFIRQHRGNRYTVMGKTPIETFNEFFGVSLPDTQYDTIGGLVIHEFGRLPQRGEQIDFAGFNFKVLRADRRRVNVLRVIRAAAGALANIDPDGDG